MKMRLNKYLADRGMASRRKADDLIQQGAVLVNGKRAEIGMLVDNSDEVVLKGMKVSAEKPKHVYYAFHKPVGIITSVDPKARDSVISFLQLDERVFPIGRLDVASSGLLLLTNDGALSERITHPRYHHEKEYVVTVDKELREEDLEVMRTGIRILGSMTKPAQVTRLSQKKFKIVLTEGKNRQIRRMCEALGYEAKKLVRIRVMNIHLGDLAEGEYRALTKKELHLLKRLLGING